MAYLILANCQQQAAVYSKKTEKIIISDTHNNILF